MKLRKVFMLLLVFILSVSLITGCSQKNVEQNQENTKKSEENSEESEKKAELPKHYVSKESMELSIHLHGGTTVFKDNWKSFMKAAELTNVTLKGTAPETATDGIQVFNIMMASGDLPDIIHAVKDNFIKYGSEGAFIPLNDLIDKHAPNYKKFLDENPDVRKFITAPDGNIYFISFVMDGKAAMGHFIRQDWLETLDLKVPTTVDDYYNVLKAFREQDPNQNDKKDEIPLFDRSGGYGLQRMVHLFGGRETWYEKDGKVHYGPIEEGYKEGIRNLAKWYKEGLIDQEVFTRGGKSRDILLGDNVGGATHDWFGSTSSYNDKLKDKISNFKFMPMAPPADVNGKVKETTSRDLLNHNGWGISVNNQYPVETIKYLDFWWSEEGRRLMNFGIEGVHHDMIDGNPIFKDEILNAEKGVLNRLKEDGVQIEIGFQQNFDYEAQWMNPVAKQGVEMYINNKYFTPQFPKLAFTVEEQKILDEKWESLSTNVQENYQRWILGAQDLEGTWDAYIKSMNDMGMQEIIRIYQAAYDRYNK